MLAVIVGRRHVDDQVSRSRIEEQLSRSLRRQLSGGGKVLDSEFVVFSNMHLQCHALGPAVGEFAEGDGREAEDGPRNTIVSLGELLRRKDSQRETDDGETIGKVVGMSDPSLDEGAESNPLRMRDARRDRIEDDSIEQIRSNNAMARST